MMVSWLVIAVMVAFTGLVMAALLGIVIYIVANKKNRGIEQ